MKLVIGGCAQGKLNYVLQKYGGEAGIIYDGKLPQSMETRREPVIINHLHKLVKSSISDGGCPEDEILAFIEDNPDCVVISDEIGNGIVPADAFDREYRERTGRILIELAARAEEVERVLCGIGQRIK